jgi:DNA-binding NtrC family response regulator
MAYSWPGNVRELQNTIERAVIMAESGRPVTAALLGLPGASGQLEFPREGVTAAEPAIPESEAAALPDLSATGAPIMNLAEMEKQAIQAALRQTDGNRTQAATALGISIRTLRNKLQEYRDSGDPVDASFDSVAT